MTTPRRRRPSTEEQLACIRLFLTGRTYQEIDKLVFGVAGAHEDWISRRAIPELLDRVHREIRLRGPVGGAMPPMSGTVPEQTRRTDG